MSKFQLLTLGMWMFISSGCSDSKEIKVPAFAVAHVDSTKHSHWGRGFYELHIYYSFKLEDSLIVGSNEHPKLERVPTVIYGIGDSILVKYDEEDLSNTKIVKTTYKKNEINL